MEGEMTTPTSTRWLPIREAVRARLAGALTDLAAVVQDREAFDNLAATQYPAVGVFFGDRAGEERPQWVANRRDHEYALEVWVAVRNLASAQAAEDELFAWVEAVEDALRGDPTLGGLVRNLAGGLVARGVAREENFWLGRAVIAVVAQKGT
jgi:hypothetical protein